MEKILFTDVISGLNYQGLRVKSGNKVNKFKLINEQGELVCIAHSVDELVDMADVANYFLSKENSLGGNYGPSSEIS